MIIKNGILKKVKNQDVIYNIPRGFFYVPDNVTIIDSYAFSDCEELQFLEMSDNVVKIEKYAFSNCTGLHEIKLSNKIREITYSMFDDDCYSLKKIIMPSVKYIGTSTFSGCISLEEVHLSQDCVFEDNIDHTFYNIPVKKILVDQDKEYHFGEFEEMVGSSSNQYSFKKEKLILVDNPNKCYEAHIYLESLVLAEGVKIVGKHQFKNCINLKNIILPKSIEVIGQAAFAGTGIEEITFTDNIKIIEEYAFDCCYNLREIKLVDVLQEIKEGAFRSCMIEEITIPKTVHKCVNAFIGCDFLEKIKVYDNIEYFVHENETGSNQKIYIINSNSFEEKIIELQPDSKIEIKNKNIYITTTLKL